MQKAEERFLRSCQAGDFSDKATKLLRESRCDPSAIRNGVAEEADEDVWWTPVHYAVKNGELKFLELLVNEYCCDPAEEYTRNIWWSPLETPLHIACRYGYLGIVKYLVTSCKCSPESKDSHNRSPLHAATAHGHEDIVKFFMENCNCGALCHDSKMQTPLYLAATLEHTDVTMFMSSVLGCTPLHVACEKGDGQEVSRLLSDNPKMVNEADKDGKTPLHYACTTAAITGVSIVEELLNIGMCNPNLIDHKGKTAFASAIESGHYERFKRILLSGRCNPNMIADNQDRTAFIVACYKEDYIVVAKLLQANHRFDTNWTALDKKGKTALQYLCCRNSPDSIAVLDLLLRNRQCKSNICGEYCKTPSHEKCDPNIFNQSHAAFIVACYREHDRAVAGQPFNTNLNATDKKGRTALHYLCSRNSQEPIDALHLLLRNRDCDPNIIDKDGTTCLHVALVYQNYPALQALLQNGKCDPNTIMKNKSFTIPHVNNTFSGSGYDLMTPLCFSYKVGDYKAMKLLLSNNQCQVNSQDSNGKTILHYACEESIAKRIIYNRVPVKVCRDHFVPLLENTNRPHKKSFFSTNFFRKSQPLTHESYYHSDEFGPQCDSYPIECNQANNEEAVCLLLSSYDCRVNIRDKYGRTPLFLTCVHNYFWKMERLLSRNSCDPSIGDNRNRTPLYIAMALHRYDMIKLLLQSSKCDPNVAISGKDCTTPHLDCTFDNCDLVTPLHLAIKMDDHRAMMLILCDNRCSVNAQDKDGKTPLHYVLDDNICEGLDTSDIYADDSSLANNSTTCSSSYHSSDDSYLDINYTENVTAVTVSKEIKIYPQNMVDTMTCILKKRTCNPNIGDNGYKTPLYMAMSLQNYEALRMLLQSDKCDPNTTLTGKGCSAPHADCSYENCDLETTLHYACRTGYIEAVSLLLQNDKCRINAQDKDGKTALHHACATECSEVVKMLVACKICKLNLTDKEGKMPLQLVLDKRNYQIAKFLIQNERCDPYSLNGESECYTSLHLACEMGDYKLVLQLLWNEKCQLIINSKDDNGKSALHYACKEIGSSYTKIAKLLLTDKNCNCNATDRNGRTPLHCACVCKASHIVEVLVADDACKLNVCDDYGKVPLQIALEENDYETIRILILTRKCDLAELMKKYTECIPLHVACKNADLEVISLLLSSNKYLIDFQDSFGKTPLHYICGAQGSDALLEAAKLILDSGCCNVNIRDNQYKTGLCEAMESKNYGVFKFLLNGGKCDLNLTIDSQDCAILHVACDKCYFEAVALLTANSQCLTNRKDVHGKTALHYICQKNLRGAGETITTMLERENIIKTLLANKECIPNLPDSDGCTPLHYSCMNGDQQAVKLLLSNCNCNPNLRNNQGLYPLQLAFRSLLEVYQVLLLSGKCDYNIVIDGKGRMPIHIACETGDMQVLSHLLSCGKCNTTAQDLKGKTALHYACIEANIEAVRMLLILANSDPTWIDNDGKTPVDYAKNYDILRQLFKHGANPSAIYYRFVLGKEVPESPVKVFVVGDGGVGKSTLVESLQRESKLARTQSVESKTAGIVPNDFKSREYGQVTLFDFAGQKQFYGTHEAFLNSAIGSSPPIFVLVLDMSAKKSLQTNLLYWQAFLQNPCVHLTIKPHLIVIGSHIDVLRDSQEDPQMKFAVIDQVMSSISASWCEFAGVVGIDCRQPRSNQMSILRRILKISCNELRIKTVLDFNCHCCFVYLLHKFRSSPAVTIAMIIAEIEAEPESAKTSDGYLNFIPETNYHLCQVLEKLNDRGHIIFITNNSELANSWVIIDRTALFNKISGAIFAPKDFKENFNISTNTGVVPLSKMKGKFFPEYDIDLLIAFLSHMEYCHEVTDRETLQLLMTEQQSSKDERYFLFPSLVTVDAPKSVWLSEAHDDNIFKFGFLMKCQDPHQFFTPRFLQILILRLAFGYAMSPDTRSNITQQLTEIKINPIHLSVLKRKCQVWKNGIFWGTNQGIECLVSISEDDQTLIILMKSKMSTSNCLQYRSTILKKITSIKEELTKLKVTEYVIDPNDTQYPLTLEGDMNMSTWDEIIKVIVECNEAAVAPTGQVLTIDHLLTFEPYAKLGKGILKQLFSSQSQHKVPADSFMTQLARQWVNKKPTVISLFNPDPILLSGKISQMNIPGPASEILCTLQLWRDIDGGNEGTYKCLREKLDQFSICCGINPLEIASSTSRDSSAVCCWCDENTVVSSKPSTALSGKYLWKHLYSLTRLMYSDF